MAAALPDHAQPSTPAASSAPQEHQKNETEIEPKKQIRVGPETEQEKKTQKMEGGENLLSSLKKKKGATDALTDVSPYGLNPPLADEVLEALQILK